MLLKMVTQNIFMQIVIAAIASVRQGFASTDVFLEMIGFDKADIRRIKSQEQRSRGQALLEETANEV